MTIRKSFRDLGCLKDETRHSIFALLHKLQRPASAQEVATMIDISPKLARFHLETLLEAGLLTAEYSRTSGRVGPGAGRTSKLYEPLDEELRVSLPPREYKLAASILLDAIGTSSAGEDAKRRVVRVARAKGRGLANDMTAKKPMDLMMLLQSVGYEPVVSKGSTFLTNCPFHQLAEQDRSLVCSMNKGFIEGMASKTPSVKVKLEPGSSRCCVVIDQLDPEKEI